MKDTIVVGNITFDKPADDWTAYVMLCIQEKSWAEAGKELAILVEFALKTQHSEQFNRDVRGCVFAFWERCNREMKAKP